MKTIPLHQNKAKIIAHRGVSALECENTCAAFVAAGNRSYFGVETDVHVTADGKFAVIHDDTTGRVSPTDLPVESSTFEQLSRITLYDPQSFADRLTRSDLKIPSLSEYIRICRYYGKRSVLELKGAMSKESIAAIIEEIRGLDHLENTIFISFWFENVETLRAMLPQQAVQFLTGEWNEDTIEKLASLRIDLDIHHGAMTKERVDFAHTKGLQVNCWTVDDPTRAEELIDWGVDYITSNILE